MVAQARRKLLAGMRRAVYHCSARCARQYFLCGVDSLTQQDYTLVHGPAL